MSEASCVHGGNVFAVARQLGVAPAEVLDFSASINPLGPPPGVAEAVAAAFARVVHYPDDGAPELRAALAGYHGCRPDEVCVANGSTELIWALPRAVGGRRALVVAPPFGEYAQALVQAGWQVDYLLTTAAEGFTLPLDQLAERLAAGYDLLLLGNPGNPTGALVPPATVAEVTRLCRQRSTFLALDEAFMDFCEESSAKGIVLNAERGMILRSLTKFFALPGLRLGYALGPTAVIARLAAQVPPWSVGTLAQAAGLAALADPAYRERTRQLIAEERCWLALQLAELPALQVYPAAANYLLVEMTTGLPAAVLRDRLLAERILIRECSTFVGLDNRFFRVAVRSRADNDRLVAALQRHLVS